MYWAIARTVQVFVDLSPPPPDFVSLFVDAFGDPFLGPFLSPSLELLVAPSDALPAPELFASPDPLDLASLLDSFFELSLDDESPLDSLLLATFFLSPDLKSVSYQPPPFNRNATAEIFFRNRSLPHEGH